MSSVIKKNEDRFNDKGVKYIGAICWYEISGEFLRAHIDVIAGKHGLKPPAKRARASFTSALAEINKRNPNHMSKKWSEDMLSITYVIADTKRTEGRRLELGDQSWVIFDKFTNSVTWKERDPRTEEFARLYRHYEDHYTAQDIRTIIQNALDRIGVIPLRAHGGLVFVPQQNRPKAEALIPFLDDLTNDCRLSLVAIPEADSIGVQSIKRDFEVGSKLTLQGIIDAIKATNEEAKKSVDRKAMIAQLAEVKRNAESMELLVQFKSSELKRLMKEASALLGKAMEA